MRRRGRFRTTFVTAIVAGLVGFVAGNAFWYLASPLWIDRVVSEELPAALQMAKEREGAFVDADTVHRGSGTATVFSRWLAEPLCCASPIFR